MIFIQKVRLGLYTRFRDILRREVSVYTIEPTCPGDIRAVCEEARVAYEDGQPRIPSRELIAYLILAKLARQDKWGGTALNKNFLWAFLLPKGGFPKGIASDRDVHEVADALYNTGLLVRKMSEGQTKYALADKAIIQPILDNKHFQNIPNLRKFFDRSRKQVLSTTVVVQ